MTTESFVEGWSKPIGAHLYHYFKSEQATLCSSWRGWKLVNIEHPDILISEGEIVPPPGPCISCTRKLEQLLVQAQPEPDPIWFPDAPGFTFFPSRGSTRLEMECQHQHGLLYVTEGAEMNWVCSSRRRPAHSLAGFFRELGELDDNRVQEAMQRWGLCFRQLPLAEQPAEEEDVETT